MQNQINITPIDAKIQSRGGHHRAQGIPGHCRFNLTTLTNIQRTVMQGYGQVVFIDSPTGSETETPPDCGY